MVYVAVGNIPPPDRHPCGQYDNPGPSTCHPESMPDGSEAQALTNPVTVTTTVTAAPPASGAAAPSPSPASQAAGNSSGTVAVPDAVGKDYQTAQNLWRTAGLHVLPAVDALGANRLAVIDANWVVLSQDPAAGTSVPRDSAITATIKKYTDK